MRVVAILGPLILIGFICVLTVWMSGSGQREARRIRREERQDQERQSRTTDDNYRQLQQAVRLLELIKERDDQLLTGVLSETHRSQAELIIRRFYRDSPGGEIEAKG